MNKFTDIIKEARKNYDSESLLSSEITKFVNKVKKVIPAIVQDVIYLTQKYNLMDRETIEEIRQASNSAASIKKLADKNNMTEPQVEDLKKLLKDLKSNINLLPQYMSKTEREMLELGKLSMSDLTIDLTSAQGRNAAAKIFMPLVYKIVSHYVGKSKLSRAELISAGTIALTNAMNDWDKSTNVPFKTYAGNRIRQQILNDINSHSHALSGYNDYAFKKGLSADAASLDRLLSGDEMNQDHLAALGFSDDDYSELDEKKMRPLYDLLEKTFSTRDVDIFYRYFALRGNKKEKSKDIAKSYGMSEGNIRNSVINKIIKFLRADKLATNILKHIQESYNISMMTNLIGLEKHEIMEALINDDMFILLEELNMWQDKQSFKYSIENALNILPEKDSKYILNVLEKGFEYLDSTFKKNKKVIILFLNELYPTDSMDKKTDVSLIEYMMDIHDAFQKHKK